MASIALDPAYRRITVEEFLEMDFGDAKAELEDGLIYMMAGGTELHARVSGNIYFALRLHLRGSQCRPYGSDLAARTAEANIRYPDVSVYCGDVLDPANGQAKLLGDPLVVIEVLSPSTRLNDEKVKLPEYRNMSGVRAILLVDPQEQRTRLVERSPVDWFDHEWNDRDDVPLKPLGITLRRSEIFTAD